MDGQLRREVGSALGNIAGGSTQGSITSGDFSFDEPTMRDIIKQWLDLGDSYDRSFRDSEAMTQIQGPGLEFASHAHAEAANVSGRAYREYLQNNRDYCRSEAQRFQNALDDYLGIEHRNVLEINKSGEPLDDGPPSVF